MRKITYARAGQLGRLHFGHGSGPVAQQLAERSQCKYDLAAAGAFRYSTVRTLFLPLSAYPMITSPRNLSKRLVGRWQSTLDVNASLSRPAISGIRLYERYFYVFPQLF